MSVKSKKQQKKDKAKEKENSDSIQQHKLHYEQYQIPPYSQQHLRALLLQYMAYDQFDYPIHHLEVFNRIRHFYRFVQNNDIYMKDLDLRQVLQELQQLGCLELSQRALGTNLVMIIERIYARKILIQAQRFHHEKPTTYPPDPITFQQQKNQLHNKDKETKLKIQSLLHAPSLFRVGNIEDQFHQFETYEQKIQTDQFSQKNIQCCDHCTRQNCLKARGHTNCTKKHFRALINQNTDESYGNCPHLNACHNPDCKLIHYVEQDQQSQAMIEKKILQERIEKAEWINCDLRFFDFKILGKFDVIMADPPWDIHMSLPYGTLKDKQMLNLKVQILQDEGLMFLWVTGRAMQLGRECLIKWGYQRVDEIVWIKTSQIYRLIITGKTGHWLNHTKEHCLVGVKGKPKINKKLDCDVIVSKVRDTSRKPDEIYSIIERMYPNSKKIQLFGRPDNCMPGWLTLGNQLCDVRLKDQNIIDRFKKLCPSQDLSQEKMNSNLKEMMQQDNRNKVYNNHIHKSSSNL